MKKLIVFLLAMLIAAPAHAGVWLKIYAQVRPAMSYAEEKCVNTVDLKETDFPAFDNQTDCETAGHTWWSERINGSFDRGDIVSIKSSGFGSWGSGECSNSTPATGGLFACVEITDKDEVHARNYIKRRLDSNLVEIEQARFYVDVSALPQAVKDELWDNGELHRTWAQVKPFIYDKITGAQIP